MLTRFKGLLLIALLMTATVAGGYGFAALRQRKTAKQQIGSVKLSYGIEDFDEVYPHQPQVRPVVISNNRLLVPVGDVLYMLDAEKRIVWKYSVEPNMIYDVRADTHGRIYLAISDGLFRVLDGEGEEVWGNFMNGSAQYSQISPYKQGMLVVINMSAYRQKGLKSEDHIEYWQNRKLVWRKDFPEQAQLEVWGEKILALKETKAGKEVVEIRGGHSRL
jgi:hypothetical protein